jgi:hypothetical protein
MYPLINFNGIYGDLWGVYIPLEFIGIYEIDKGYNWIYPLVNVTRNTGVFTNLDHGKTIKIRTLQAKNRAI